MNQPYKPTKFGNLDVDQKSFELLSKLDAYGEIHFDSMVDKFVTCFETYCEKVSDMQEMGKKNPITFINFSVLRTNLLVKNHELRIDAYDENWYLDRIECLGSYDVSELYRWHNMFADSLEATRKKYMGKLKYSEMQKLIFEESNKYLIFVAELMRVAIKKVVLTESFQKMKRNEVFIISIGEYQDSVDILYKEDSTIKDEKQVRRYLETEKDRDKPFNYEICENLDLSKGKFEGLHLIFSNFSGCNFTDANLKDSTLLMNEFKGTTFKNSNLENSQLFNVDFSGAILENIDFKGSKLKHISFKGATLINVNFDEALLLMQLDFEDATLIDTTIPEERGMN